MQKGVKFRIYPNREQKNLINQTFGCCRFIYNKGLTMRNEAYQNGNKIGYSQTSAMLTELKKCDDFSFLKVVDSIALQQSLRDLDRGFVNFFQKRAAHPVFKSKHNHHQSYRTINQGDNIRIVGRYIKLPKLGYVKVRQSMEIGHINNVTVERTPAGKYFAVLNVEFEPIPKPNGGGEIGIDVGITEFYSDSNENMVPNPGGNTIIRIPTMYPSSQTCSCCGYKNPLVKNLAVREWECPECHIKHNRDTNAGINILNKGLLMQSA